MKTNSTSSDQRFVGVINDAPRESPWIPGMDEFFPIGALVLYEPEDFDCKVWFEDSPSYFWVPQSCIDPLGPLE